jgi:hypothetical protein
MMNYVSILTVAADNEDDTGASDVPIVFVEERDAVLHGVARIRELCADGASDVVDALVARFESDLCVVFPHAVARKYTACVQTAELRAPRMNVVCVP